MSIDSPSEHSQWKDIRTRQMFAIIYIVGYSLCMICFISLLCIHHSLRFAFHPVFNFYITQFFLGYIICELSVVVRFIIIFCTDDPTSEILKPIGNSDIARFIVYSYLLPTVFFSTIERLAATIFVSRYENMGPWGYVFTSQIFGISLIACINLFANEGAAYRLRAYMAIAIEICVYIVIIALFLVNRYRNRLRASSNFTQQTSRFQLAENIRACRFLLIFVIMDSLIAITDSVMDIGFNISTNFDPSRCSSDPGYLPMFAVYRSFIILLGVTNPCLLVTIGHVAYRNKLRKLMGLRKEPKNKFGMTKVWNISNDQVQTTINTDQYFSQLVNEWEGPGKNKRKKAYR